MNQPILLLRAGTEPATSLAAEILRCEGFPWFSEMPADRFVDAAPGIRLIIVAGSEVSPPTAQRIAVAAASGVTILALAPSPHLVRTVGLELGGTLQDPDLTVVDLSGWEHDGLALLCPGDSARILRGGQAIAVFQDPAGNHCGGGVVSTTVGQGSVQVYGYDLCQVIATLRHGTGALDPPLTSGRTWGGPRALYGFQELAEKLPHTVPVADVHQDVLRCLVANALADTMLPRVWHFQDAAPSVFMVRGDGCGEEGAELEVDILEQHEAFLTFCRPRRSRYAGDLMRAWHARGHGISIEANINAITQQIVGSKEDGTTRSLTAAELNAGHLPAIRDNLVDHRDAFHRETGLEMETFMTHSAQWTGLPMARMAEELGWRTLMLFQSIDPGQTTATQRGPYVMPTALPMRYFDPQAGVLDLWHIPYQWIDLIWQTVASQKQAGVTDAHVLANMLGMDGEQYGQRIGAFTEEAARRWHVAQVCSFHPVYVAKPWPYLGSSQQALEIALKAARDAGARFDNLESWSRFVRGRDSVRMVGWRPDGVTMVATLQSQLDVQGLSLLLSIDVDDVRNENGSSLPLRDVELEGKRQRAICIDLQEERPVTLILRHKSHC
jgi:hypothetical protein